MAQIRPFQTAAHRIQARVHVKDTVDMYARLDPVSRGLEWTNLRHRANYQPMLDRLAGAGPVEPLRILADACESLGIDVRRDARKYTSLVDLTRFVDAVRPQSESVRHLQQAARRLTPAELAAVRGTTGSWAENDARLAPVAGNAFVGELAGLSRE